MPRTLDHIVRMHDVVTERRAAGRPVWDATLNLKQFLDADVTDDTMTGPRDQIVAAIRAHAWFTNNDEFSALHEVVENLADAEDLDEFNGWFDELYDLADHDRVWIG